MQALTLSWLETVLPPSCWRGRLPPRALLERLVPAPVERVLLLDLVATLLLWHQLALSQVVACATDKTTLWDSFRNRELNVLADRDAVEILETGGDACGPMG